ncbi:COG5377 Phage-related protein, predicted endonuclease [uncultured Caudovirales phage]|uniref:COG5377 Phage-related protein, predicted endonuclease n=1 Tax=uncultured Caudovirales phage TaxID=2100421 RepID=A0A6J5NFH2_9CAUD|nr:COG5377 Phage-related protein, predicted endonuclease [uncultured Caudovirales phage]
MENRSKMRGIGGSDAAIVAGISKYKSQYQLWMEKTGKAEPFKGNEATHWGTKLEDVVAEEYTQRTGRKVRRVNMTQYHPEYDFIFGHVDRVSVGDKRIVEIKTSLGKYRSDADWGEAGSDSIPEAYYLQVQHYMAVMQSQVCDVAALVSGDSGAELRIYEIQRDDKLISDLIAMEKKFWEYVESDTPPPVRDTRDLAVKYPKDDDETVIASMEIYELVNRLKEMKSAKKEMDDAEEKIKTEIQKFMEEKAYLVSQSGNKLASWKLQTTERVDTSLLKKELDPAVLRKYTKISESRVFRL